MYNSTCPFVKNWIIYNCRRCVTLILCYMACQCWFHIITYSVEQNVWVLMINHVASRHQSISCCSVHLGILWSECWFLKLCSGFCQFSSFFYTELLNLSADLIRSLSLNFAELWIFKFGQKITILVEVLFCFVSSERSHVSNYYDCSTPLSTVS
jgi:hypothetical protein